MRVRVRRSIRARRPARGRRARRAGFRRAFRKVGNPMPTFSEMFKPDPLTATTGGTFQYSISQVPQIASYTALYRMYRILRAQIILVPRQITNTTGGASSSDYGQPAQLTYAINDSSDATSPGAQIDVLESNGAKVRLLNRPLKLSFRPVADLNVNANSSGGVVPINLSPSTFISLDQTGPNVIHRGIDYYFQQYSNGTQLAVDVFVKLTFQLKDPR